MSKNLPKPDASEEVDLAKLFKLVGHVITNFFSFVGRCFNKFFFALVWFVFFIKKHSVKILIAGALGGVYGVYKEKTSDPIYKSHIIVKQNYKIGEDLYSSINYFNDLLVQKDTSQLGNVLGIGATQASLILHFDIESVVSENARLKEFNDYLKTLDTAVASKVSYEDFLVRYNESNYQFQKITITAREKNNFNLVFGKIVDFSNTNPYYVREQAKDLAELKRKEEAISQALANSQALQNTYMRVLEKPISSKGTEIGITLEGSGNKTNTNEYDLYLNDIQLRRDLVEIEREKADQEKIVEIISGKKDSGYFYNSKNLLGRSVSPKVYYGLCFMVATFFVVVVWQVFNFLEQYKNKI